MVGTHPESHLAVSIKTLTKYGACRPAASLGQFFFFFKEVIFFKEVKTLYQDVHQGMIYKVNH